jgi:uncharacterized protein (TIGR02145 family)
MEKKYHYWILPIIAIGFVLIFTNSCKKDDNNNPGNPTNGKTTAVFNSQLSYGTMTDQDRNTYKTIKIGTQTWMAENLRTTKYRNGEAITEVSGRAYWISLNTNGAYCNYKNTMNYDTIATYGRLYNWYAVKDIRNIAPTGWHVASDAEWSTLTTYLGGESVAGSKLKETGTTHWLGPNSASNASGFTALPGGVCGADGEFNLIKVNGIWWTSVEGGIEDSVWGRDMNSGSSIYSFTNNNKNFGYSVRCLKDN